MSDASGNGNGNGKDPNGHLAALESEAETGSAADAKKVAADARASATHGPNRAAAAGMPAEKPQDLTGSVKRLAGLMRPERMGAIIVMVGAIVSVAIVSVDPRLGPYALVDVGVWLGTLLAACAADGVAACSTASAGRRSRSNRVA